MLEVGGKLLVRLAKTFHVCAGNQIGKGVLGGISGKYCLRMVRLTTGRRAQVSLGELADELAALVAQIDGAAAQNVQIWLVRVFRRKLGAATEVANRELLWQPLEHLFGQQVERMVAGEKVANFDQLHIHRSGPGRLKRLTIHYDVLLRHCSTYEKRPKTKKPRLSGAACRLPA